MPAGHEYCLCSLGGFARARIELEGLPAGLCLASLSTGLGCSHSLRFGQGPVFLELSKHLYWEMFYLVSFWRGSRGVQSSIACLSFWALTWDAKTSHVPEALWGSKFCWLAWLLQMPVQAFAFPCNCGVWVPISFFFLSLWHEVRVNLLTPKAGQSVNHYCTPEASFCLQAAPCSMFDLLFPPETAEVAWEGAGRGVRGL